MKYDLILAHEYSSNHKRGLLTDSVCSCFFCFEIYSPLEITEWLPDETGTGLCPYCGVDAVIGSCSGFPMELDFLKSMHEYWFN